MKLADLPDLLRAVRDDEGFYKVHSLCRACGEPCICLVQIDGEDVQVMSNGWHPGGDRTEACREKFPTEDSIRGPVLPEEHP